MARKAFCFYQALKKNNLITQNTNCIVLSSRALNYNIESILQGKRIALVDDVVVKGNTLESAFRMLTLMKADENLDVYIAACCEEVARRGDVLYTQNLIGPYIHLSESAIYELTGYIASFINRSTLSYNVDEPRCCFSFNNEEELVRFTNNYKSNNITSYSQRICGINSLVVHYDAHLLKPILSHTSIYEKLVRDTQIKLRILYNQESLIVTMIPIVLLPALSFDELHELFDSLGLAAYYEHVNIEYNPRKTAANQLAFVQYYIGKILVLTNIEKQYTFSSKIDDEGEFAIFGTNIELKNLPNLHSDMWLLYQTTNYENCFKLNDCLSAVYDVVLNYSLRKYYNDMNEELQIPLFSIFDIFELLQEKGNYTIGTVSHVVDILIDRGFLVPSHVFAADSRIVRAYRTGEVTRLSENEVRVFAHFIGLYCEHVERELDRLEFEKLCVLLFRYCHEKGIFRRDSLSRRDHCDDCYDICYTQFGPRISSSEFKYKIKGNESCLVSFMKRLSFLAENKSRKYYVPNRIDIPECYNAYEYDLDLLAICLSELDEGFSEIEIREENRCFLSLVENGNDLLTLMAIGDNEKEQILSLVAEISLFSSLNSGIESIELLTKYIGSIMDGVWSGVWKYKCYSHVDNIPKEIIQSGLSRNPYHYSILSSCVSRRFDANTDILNFRDYCGDFLTRIAIFYEELKSLCTKKNIGRKMPAKMDFCSEIAKDRLESREEAMTQYLTLKNEAQALIDICEVYLHEGAFSHSSLDTVYVIHCREMLSIDILRDCHRLNFQGNNIQGNSLVVLRFEKENSPYEIIENMQYILKRCNNSTVQIVYCRLKSWLEGVQCCLSTGYSRGDYFDRLIGAIIRYETEHTASHGNEVLFCRKDTEPSQFPQRDFPNALYQETQSIWGEYIIERYVVNTMSNGGKNMGNDTNERTYNYNQAGGDQKIRTQIIFSDNSGHVEINANQKDDWVIDCLGKNGYGKLLEDLERIRAVVENGEFLDKDEISKGLSEATEAAKAKDNTAVKCALSKIAKLGESILTKVSATAVVELLKDLHIEPFV